MPGAAGSGLPGGEAAPLVSIPPRSPAGNYTQIKNVSKSHFSSSQVWAETCDPALAGTEPPCSTAAAARGRTGSCTPTPHPTAGPSRPCSSSPPSSSSSTAPCRRVVPGPGLVPPHWCPAGLRAAKGAGPCARDALDSQFIPFP